MNKNMKRAGAFGLVGASVMAIGTMAYFTDRVEVNASVEAGTVGITETQTWAENLIAGPQNLNNINPGDSRSLTFKVANTGTKAIDTRHTLKVSVFDAAGNPKAMTEGLDVNEETMLQFDIFKASDVDTMSGKDPKTHNGGYVLKNGAQPVFSSDAVDSTTMMGAKRDISKIDKGVVTYYFADSVLDGVGDAAKIETGYSDNDQNTTPLEDTDVAVLDGTTAVDYNYVLIFRDTTLNDFQGCTVHVELVVEAKQHLNTNSSWQNIETIEYNMVVSGKSEQDTTINTAPNNHIGVLETVTDDTAGTYNTHVAH